MTATAIAFRDPSVLAADLTSPANSVGERVEMWNEAVRSRFDVAVRAARIVIADHAVSIGADVEAFNERKTLIDQMMEEIYKAGVMSSDSVFMTAADPNVSNGQFERFSPEAQAHAGATALRGKQPGALEMIRSSVTRLSPQSSNPWLHACALAAPFVPQEAGPELLTVVINGDLREEDRINAVDALIGMRFDGETEAFVDELRSGTVEAIKHKIIDFLSTPRDHLRLSAHHPSATTLQAALELEDQSPALTLSIARALLRAEGPDQKAVGALVDLIADPQVASDVRVSAGNALLTEDRPGVRRTKRAAHTLSVEQTDRLVDVIDRDSELDTVRDVAKAVVAASADRGMSWEQRTAPASASLAMAPG